MTSLRSQLAYTPVELAFGTSGLRGLVSDMTDLECYINTRGFINFLRANQQLEPGSIIYYAGDLRKSTPRILASVCVAITDAGFVPNYCGTIPTPAIAYYAQQNNAPCIMVTGSHIPADRNGIKFYKRGGELLKSDEQAVKTAVAVIRQEIYAREANGDTFDTNGMLIHPPKLPDANEEAANTYINRYRIAFSHSALQGKTIVLYQHSAVGRDMIETILTNMGATVVPVGRSDEFVAIDSENVTAENRAYFRQLASENPGLFAIVSTDGDSDRPFVIDENGIFHRGDELGAIVAKWLGIECAIYPISSSDAIDQFLTSVSTPYYHTKIGSPYVIDAMHAVETDSVAGWEVNGGFLLGTTIATTQGTLDPLETRDAVLPIVGALLASVEAAVPVSVLFDVLPKRYTSSGLIDNFPIEVARHIVTTFREDTPENHTKLAEYFSTDRGFSPIRIINSMDGVRIYFENSDIAHIRPSGNAPQLRAYSVANSQERADEIVRICLAEPDGIFRMMQKNLPFAS